MTHTKVLVFILILSFTGASAQMMNVRKWRKTERDSLDNGMLLYEENQFLQALPIFENLVNQHPKEEFLKYIFAKCALYRSDKHEAAYNYLSEVYEKNKKIPDMNLDMATAAHYSYKFDEAEKYLNEHFKSRKLPAESKTKGETLRKYIFYARQYYTNPTGAKVINLGDIVNSEADEYTPAITADESSMIYTYCGPRSIGGKQNAYLQPDPQGSYMEDIYMALKQDDEFKVVFPLDSLNTNAPDAAIAISNDGTRLFLYKDIGDGHGDIFVSDLIGENFSIPYKLRGEVNSYSWDGHCSLSPDGQTLYFSSERSGGYGGRDIYRARLLPDSTWGNVVNLGDSVNTPLDDDAPFIHSDGVTLYFSSKGRTSMGGYDVFKAVMDPVDSTFKKSENLGYPINSPADDIYFVLAANGKNAYYSSAKKDGKGLKDIYRIETNFTGSKPALYLVKGMIKSGEKPVSASLKIEVTSKDNRMYRYMRSNSANGIYMITLPAGDSYRFTYAYADKPEQTMTVDATSISEYMEKIYDVNFEAPEPLATETKSVTSVTPTVAATTKTTQAVAANTTPVESKTTAIATKTPVTSVTSIPKPVADASFPKTGPQMKSLRFAEKYGDITHDEVEFRVQIAAVKTIHAQNYPKKLGKMEPIDLNDGFKRITVGGAFKTLAEAYEHNRKVVKAGQPEGFIIILYKGKRATYEELEQAGIFK